ncbi:MAG: hypothetical protein JXB38_07005 [Anaerolineales bacterium]|nr:hypothetical protein [Anaerolineales bacterium]
MTAQRPDTLIYGGKQYPIYTEPLEAYFRLGNRRPAFRSPHTGLWRGYVANWKIETERLYLVGLEAWLGDISGEGPLTQAGIEVLFPDANGPVMADWYSGGLRVQMGELLQYVHMGYESVYEQELLLTVENGRVVGKVLVDNRAK